METVGEGTFAKVYKIRRLKDSKFFASKALAKNQVKDKKDLAALVNEIKLLKKLGQDQTQLSLLEVHESDTYIYLVLELAEGGMLYDKLRYQGQFNEMATKAMIQSILKGLIYIHSKGIMHRDLHLENVLLQKPDSLDDLKIIDFGLSKMMNEKNSLFQICGTPGFIAPEILRRQCKTYSEKCDIFSLGVIGFTLITGKSPFPGKQMIQRLRRNKKCAIDFSLIQKAGATIQCQQLLQKMLSVDPCERPLCTDLINNEYFNDYEQFLNPYKNSVKSILEELGPRELTLSTQRETQTQSLIEERIQRERIRSTISQDSGKPCCKVCRIF